MNATSGIVAVTRDGIRRVGELRSIAATLLVTVIVQAPTTAEAQEPPEQIIFGRYLLNEVEFTDPSGFPRIRFDAVAVVPDVEGAVRYILESRGGYDPHYYRDKIDMAGPPFSGDAIEERPASEHWWFLSGGGGPPDGADSFTTFYNSRFESGWDWKVRVVFTHIAARLKVEPRVVDAGEKITATIEVTNVSPSSVTGVVPSLTVTSDGHGVATLVSGPTPSNRSLLFSSETATFTYEYTATKSGLVTFRGSVSATDFEGNGFTVEVTADCPAPNDPACADGDVIVEIVDENLEVVASAASFDYVLRSGETDTIQAIVGTTSEDETDVYTDVSVELRAFALHADGAGSATVLSSSPDPPRFDEVRYPTHTQASFETLFASTDIDDSGSLVAVDVSASGRNENGELVRASRRCSGVSSFDGRSPGCDAETGRMIFKVYPGCGVEIVDVSPGVTVTRPGLAVERRPDDTIVACGGGGTCKLIDDPAEYASTLEQHPLDTSGTFKNVGQEIILRAAIALPAGRSVEDVSKVEWTIAGTTIEAYQDFSAFQRGTSDVFLFKPYNEGTNRVVTKGYAPDTDEANSNWDKVWFFWKEPGVQRVDAAVTIDGGDGDDFNCRDTLLFDVGRDRVDPLRQPEKFYPTCCGDARDPDLVGRKDPTGFDIDNTLRVASMHATLHRQDDAQPIFPGDNWIGFHRVLVDSYNTWREYFGYPPVGMWDGSVPIPASENGYVTTDVSRFTSVPKCGQSFAGADALCPIPPWFTREGALDDFGSPIVRPDEPFADMVDCKTPAGAAVEIGQAVIDDFETDVALGCVLAKTWHANLHALINGSMLSTVSSPEDPVFWRLHHYLSGAEIGGAPGLLTASRGRAEVGEEMTPVYLAWELAKAEGPPGVSVAMPQAGFAVAALPTVVVQFWEDVDGVTADDVTVDGSAATTLEVQHVAFGSGSGRDYYVFSGFTEPSLGDVAIQVSPGGITDAEGNPFGGTSWTVTLAEDSDEDGVPDVLDNCPAVLNSTQRNSDRVMLFSAQYDAEPHDHHGGDDLGDACDNDDDDDGISDVDELERGSNPLDANDPDGCSDDVLKRKPGLCGCGVPDVDSDGDGFVDCGEECPNDPDAIVAPCGSGCAAGQCLDVDSECKRCGQPMSGGASPTASDALAVLLTAVGLQPCAHCVCDVDGSGSIVASDALKTLQRAVGQPVELACQAAQHH